MGSFSGSRASVMEDFYKTNDMAQVTCFKIEGHVPQSAKWEGSTCYWYFRATDALLDLLEDFQDGNCRVEPRRYNREFGQVKREFYELKNQFGS